MVANGRRPLFGTLAHNGTNAEVEKTMDKILNNFKNEFGAVLR